MKQPATFRRLCPRFRTAAQALSAHPQQLPRPFLLAPIFIPAALCLSTGFSSATAPPPVTTYQVGGGLGVTGIDQTAALAAATSFWTTKTINWTPIGGSDSADLTSRPEFDFVGNSTYAGLFYANTTDYVFFRMRVDADTIGTTTATSPLGTYALLIDIITDPSPTSPSGAVSPIFSPFTGSTGIDYAIVWDSKNHGSGDHGLEMSRAGANGGSGDTWQSSNLNDIDGTNGGKQAIDINGGGRTTDGYCRTTDNQVTTGIDNFGTTTLIDFAVKWTYLTTNTKLNTAQTWKVTVASITGDATGVSGNDHQNFNADVFGSSLTSSISSASWSAVPEPTNALAGLLVAAGLFRRRRA